MVVDGENSPRYGPFSMQNSELSTGVPMHSIRARKPRLFNAIKDDVRGDDYTAVAMGSNMFTTHKNAQPDIPTHDHGPQPSHKPPTGRIALNQSQQSMMSSTANSMQSNSEQLHVHTSLESTALGSLGGSMNGMPSTRLEHPSTDIPQHLVRDEGNISHPIPGDANLERSNEAGQRSHGLPYSGTPIRDLKPTRDDTPDRESTLQGSEDDVAGRASALSGRASVLSDGDDELDVMTKVMQPGASAQPLVDSIKLDLQNLTQSDMSTA